MYCTSTCNVEALRAVAYFFEYAPKAARKPNSIEELIATSAATTFDLMS